MSSTTKTHRITSNDQLLPRRLAEADEFLHKTGTETPMRWQENMMVEAWDLETNIGFWFHIQRIPARGFCELKYAIMGEGQGASGRAVVPMAEKVMYEGLIIEKPFRLLRLKHDGMAVPTVADTDIPCMRDDGEIPVGFDVTLNGLTGPIDWHVPLSQLFHSIESDHYEMAGTWEGTLRLGDKTIKGSGLFFRDHTWGNRNYTPDVDANAERGKGGFSWAWWTPVVLDDGKAFFNGLSVLSNSGHRPQFTTVTEGEDTILLPVFEVDVPEGSGKNFEICRYQAVEVNCGPEYAKLKLDVNRHLPMYLPDHDPNRAFVQSDGFGKAKWGDRSGWGSAQLSLCTPDWKSWPEFKDQIALIDKS